MREIGKNYLLELVQRNHLELKSTQAKLSIPIINRLYKKMLIGIPFDEIKVVDNLIMDGHHRYLASLVAGKEFKSVPYHKTSATDTIEWKLVFFDEADWDSEDEIKEFNNVDAEKIGLTIDEFEELLNK